MRWIWNFDAPCPSLPLRTRRRVSGPRTGEDTKRQDAGMERPTKARWRRAWESLVPFPKVLAEESAAATDSSPSYEKSLPPHIKGPLYPESGWDRLKELFVRDEHLPVPQEIEYIYKAAASGAVVGWIYGGIPAFRHAKQRYISQSHAEIYSSQFDAMQSAHRAAIRGFIRYGWRWGWRTAVFVTIFNTVSVGLNVYRNKNAMSHFVVAGAATGSLFRMHLGLTSLVAGGLFGAILGAPFGLMFMIIQKFQGETVWDRKQKERKEIYEFKLSEWKARLRVTDAVTEEFQRNLGENQSEIDVERIEELLNLPRNPSLTTDSKDRD
ncbi:complex I assembly factor TIMMDC1, mitochondrial [Sarcophilus harrisii]|uniref:Complex I assembly factor TIMMDC1, mitochondrial n=1 Tax=Sarcophilus harrisii TaxID=9305 RepID=A0A7N4UXW0_SARHA|nr:complex I assembly factor TIMMDC1, mitochondrial [Sarcophilus harrisii]